MCFRFQGSICLLIACLTAGIAGHSKHASGEDPTIQVTQQAEWEARIEAALDAKGEWEFEDVPLNEVCAVIQEKLGIDVVLDVKALEDHGIDSSTPITRSLLAISNRSFLRLMLRDLGLTYTMQLGALWITTPEYAESQLTTKVHPVGDLLEQDSSFGEPVVDYSVLIQAITSAIAPNAWDSVGGPGAIGGIYDAIVISQTSDVHEEVEQCLTTYRTVISNAREGDDPEQAVFILGQEVSSMFEAVLDKPLTSKFEDVPLKEVVEFISETMNIPIVIHTRALEDFGIDASTPISAKFTETRLRFALKRMLNELELTYVIRDEILLITTPEEAEARLIIGLYPVRELVEVGDDSSIEPLGARRDFESLKNLIQSTIAPDTWDEVGGPSTIAHLLPLPTLLIAQTQDVHDEISVLLTKLRAAKKLEAARTTTKEDADPAALIVRSYPIYAVYNAPDEIVKLVMRASEPGTWDDAAGTFVQGLGMSIVVKHNASGHRQVQKLLLQLGVWSPLHRSGKGLGGRGGVAAPVVGGLQATPSGERPSPGGFF